MTITKEGALASFYTVNKAPIKHLKVYFNPKQAGSGDPSPSNVRPISGWTGLDVSNSGKNLFDIDAFVENAEMYISNKRGTVAYDAQAKSISVTVSITGNYTVECHIKPSAHFFTFPVATIVTYSYKITNGKPNSGGYLRSGVYFSNGTNTFGNCSYANGNYIRSITIPANTYITDLDLYASYTGDVESEDVIVFSEIQFEFGASASSYEAYNGFVVPVSWESLGTIYGGYVDLISGKLVKEYNLVTFTWGQMTSANVLGNYERRAYNVSSSNFISASAGDLNNKPNRRFCNIAPWSWSYYADSLHYYVDKGYAYVFLPPNSNDNITIQIAILLNTPIEYQLTPQQLQTFIGRNNIWSNADRVEIEYDLAESNDELYRRRNIILQGAPHLENTSGNIANFNTDLVASIKDAKIYFNPIQEGSGNPSLENIRNITGFNEMNIYKASKNLLNPAYYTRSSSYESNGITYTHDGNGIITMNGDSNGESSQVSFSWTQPIDEDYYFCGNTSFSSTVGDVYVWDLTTSARPTQWDGSTASRSSNTALREIKLLAGHRIQLCVRVYSTNTTTLTNATAKPILVHKTCSDKIFEPHNGTTIPIDWTSDYGTIYGGYVDLINNEIVETWHSITADGVNIKANSQYIRNQTKIGGGIVYISPYGNHQSDSLFNTTVLCNKLPTVSQQGQNLTEPYLWCARNGMLFVIFYLWNASDFETTPTKQETINATNAWLQENPVTIVYKLNTPIHHQLTPQQLKTLKGVNNIWSNANSTINIKYWTH